MKSGWDSLHNVALYTTNSLAFDVVISLVTPALFTHASSVASSTWIALDLFNFIIRTRTRDKSKRPNFGGMFTIEIYGHANWAWTHQHVKHPHLSAVCVRLDLSRREKKKRKLKVSFRGVGRRNDLKGARHLRSSQPPRSLPSWTKFQVSLSAHHRTRFTNIFLTLNRRCLLADWHSSNWTVAFGKNFNHDTIIFWLIRELLLFSPFARL